MSGPRFGTGSPPPRRGSSSSLPAAAGRRVWCCSRLAATGNAQNAVFECSFNPIDNTVVCVTGDGICRFLRITDQTLKPLPGAMGKREPQAGLRSLKVPPALLEDSAP